MNLKWIWWVFENAIHPEICNRIIDVMQQSKKERASVGFTKNKKNLTKKDQIKFDKTRKSYVCFSNEKWMYRTIHPWIHKANEMAGWNFQWDHSESIQLTQYTPGEFYTWHCDSWPEPYVEEGPFKGKIRKLSSVLALNDSSEYEGGKLEFSFMGDNLKKKYSSSESMLKKGSIIVFPSFVWHRVSPVTKGTRYSMTNWHCGKPFI